MAEYSRRWYLELHGQPWIDEGRTDYWNIHDNETYIGLLYTLREQVGWQPFVDTFHHFRSLSIAPPDTDEGKVELFAHTLSRYADRDLTPHFRSWGFPVQPLYHTSLWDFGDGITSTLMSPTHTYTAEGVYTVTLTVYGPGGTDTLTRASYISVNAPLSYTEGIANGDFEYDGDWVIPATEYPATYTAIVTHGGNQAMRAGIIDPADNRYSYSSAQQTVTIPIDAISATLHLWLYPTTEEEPTNLSFPTRPLAATIQEAALPGDAQYVLILNEYEQWIDTLVWQRRNDQVWTLHEFDLGKYAGRTIKLHFGAYNDGSDGVTGMYVDDISLEVYAPTARRLSRGQVGASGSH